MPNETASPFPDVYSLIFFASELSVVFIIIFLTFLIFCAYLCLLKVLNDTFRVNFYSSYTDNMLLAINEDRGLNMFT